MGGGAVNKVVLETAAPLYAELTLLLEFAMAVGWLSALCWRVWDVFGNTLGASSLAAASLQDLGLQPATDMIGGFQAWRATGLPIVPPSKTSISCWRRTPQRNNEGSGWISVINAVTKFGLSLAESVR
jgi:hypothetical protein